MAENISVRAGGKMEALSDVGVPRMTINTLRFTVNGMGYFRTNDLMLITHNLTIDMSGLL